LAEQAMTEALKESYLELAANWDAFADEAAGKDAQKKLAAQDPPPRQLI
jgi:hypothetical protein